MCNSTNNTNEGLARRDTVVCETKNSVVQGSSSMHAQPYHTLIIVDYTISYYTILYYTILQGVTLLGIIKLTIGIIGNNK